MISPRNFQLTRFLPSNCHSCGSTASALSRCSSCAVVGLCIDCSPSSFKCLHCSSQNRKCACLPLRIKAALNGLNLPTDPLDNSGWSVLDHSKLDLALGKLRSGRLTRAEFFDSQPFGKDAIYNYLLDVQDWIDRNEFELWGKSLKQKIFTRIQTLPVSQWPEPSQFKEDDWDTVTTASAALAEAEGFRRRIHLLSESTVSFEEFEREWLSTGKLNSLPAKQWVKKRFELEYYRSGTTVPPVVIK